MYVALVKTCGRAGKGQAKEGCKSELTDSADRGTIHARWKEFPSASSFSVWPCGGCPILCCSQVSGAVGGGGLIVNLPKGVVTIRSDLEGRFAGQTIVKQGILSLGSINNYNANGALGYNAWPVILGDSGTTGTLKYTGGSVSRNRGFTMTAGGAGVFQIDTAGSNLTLSGLIDGDGDLVKTGPGTLALPGPNTYTGDTIVMAGTLIIGNGGSGSGKLADASTVKISVDARMDLNFGGEDQIAELWLGGAKVPYGSYNSSINTPIDYRSYFTGTGSLLVVPRALLGDANGDSVVDAADYDWLKQHFGLSGDEAAGANLDGLGTVDFADLQILMNALNTSGAPATNTPEPCSAMLLVFGAAALLKRKRKS